ncbi:MAG: DUF1552 domain-containing protein [Planctomycetota bacterium]
MSLNREKKPISRRMLLRSAAACLPLPLLDSGPSWAAPPQAEVQAAAPKRFVWLFQPNGMYPGAWNPTGQGHQMTLPKTLRPFEKYRSQMTVLRNLTTTASGNHVGKCSALLTGVQVHRDAERGVYANRKSIDQWIASEQAGQTQISSLQLGIERPGQGYCSSIDTPVSYGATLSWSDATTRLMPQVNPRSVFDRLFDQRSPQQIRESARWQSSLLDSLGEQVADVRRAGSHGDRRKLDEYLESVRAVERRLQARVTTRTPSWIPPNPPNENEMCRPDAGLPRDRRDHMRLILDLITLAFWTDSTRVATLMMANTLSDADLSFIDGVDRPFHSGCSHHQNKSDKIAQYTAINHWHAEQAAYLCGRLSSIDEGDGSLLDHSLVFFGSSLKDGNAHSNRDLPITAIGGAGGAIHHRGHYDCGEERNIVDLHQTVLHAFDLPQSNFNGMETDVINDLLA